jgi:energy-coupling factor transporter ATP-binding protein EcfA2
MSEAISNLQNGKQVLVVAISGPSSSGKSTLASLLGIIFQSNSENKSTSMYSTFYSTIIFQNIHILLRDVELQMPNSFSSVRRQQKGVHFPIFQNSQEASKFSTSRKSNSHYPVCARKIRATLSSSPFVTRHQDNIGACMKHKANWSFDSNPPRQLLLPRQESKSSPDFCIYQS